MPDVIMRPDGRPYRPRKVTANAVVNEDDFLSGVIVLGTHDIACAVRLATEYVQWQLDAGYCAVDPLPGWYRDAFEGGHRRWVSDEKRGRAGVWFRDIVETSDG